MDRAPEPARGLHSLHLPIFAPRSRSCNLPPALVYQRPEGKPLTEALEAAKRSAKALDPWAKGLLEQSLFFTLLEADAREGKRNRRIGAVIRTTIGLVLCLFPLKLTRSTTGALPMVAGEEAVLCGAAACILIGRID